MTNKKFQSIIKELFVRCRKINISLVFITQSYFPVRKDVRNKRLEVIVHAGDIYNKLYDIYKSKYNKKNR